MGENTLLFEAVLPTLDNATAPAVATLFIGSVMVRSKPCPGKASPIIFDATRLTLPTRVAALSTNTPVASTKLAVSFMRPQTILRGA